MSETTPVTWQQPRAGFEYTQDSVSVSRAHQLEKLGACGIDAAVFGDVVDPSFFIGIAIHAGINSGISAEGNVNMLQGLVQHRPALLDEPLVVNGRITAVTPVPRGVTIDTDVWFEDHQGEHVITARRRSLKPGVKVDAQKQHGAGARPPPVIKDVTDTVSLADHRLTPAMVKAYSMEGNSIHYELEAAQRAGFRAPLIGGGMGVHYLLAALWARRSPDSIDLDIFFRRPIFWDAEFEVVCVSKTSVASDVANWSALGILQASGETKKVATEMRVNAQNY
jgi:hypothetical protein